MPENTEKKEFSPRLWVTESGNYIWAVETGFTTTNGHSIVEVLHGTGEEWVCNSDKQEVLYTTYEAVLKRGVKYYISKKAAPDNVVFFGHHKELGVIIYYKNSDSIKFGFGGRLRVLPIQKMRYSDTKKKMFSYKHLTGSVEYISEYLEKARQYREFGLLPFDGRFFDPSDKYRLKKKEGLWLVLQNGESKAYSKEKPNL